jgi:hypothetical protein
MATALNASAIFGQNFWGKPDANGGAPLNVALFEARVGAAPPRGDKQLWFR